MYLPNTLVPSIHFCNRLYMLRLYDDKFQTYGKINYIFADNQCHIFQFHKLKKKPRNSFEFVCGFFSVYAINQYAVFLKVRLMNILWISSAYFTLCALGSVISWITSIHTWTVNMVTLFIMCTFSTRVDTSKTKCTSVTLCKDFFLKFPFNMLINKMFIGLK